MSSERLADTINSPWWGEHIHRYQVALGYLPHTGKMLDIACGNGFGTHFLGKATNANIIGADVDPLAISQCIENYHDLPNIEFRVIDGTSMCFDSSSFDAIVSFETIEHTREYDKMLSEFCRVLKPGAIAVISTPNIVINSPGGVVHNPYHTQEFTYQDLKTLLKRHFNSVEIGGQEYTRYNKKSFANWLGKRIEYLFYLRGVRKIPLAVQNAVMRMLIGKDMYPSASDFEIVHDIKKVIRCKTFFAICKKSS